MTTRINISEHAGVRLLHFGSTWVQGAMRIARPWNLELEYTREMMVPLLLREARHWPRKVLLIGLGAASLTKFLYRHFPLAHLTVVEIDPLVVATARQYFKLPDDPKRIHLVVGDGVEYVLGCDKQFDLILVDGFDGNARAGALETQPFYQACHACLSPRGLLSVNMLTHSRSYQRTTGLIASAFANRSLVFPSCESGNAIAIAATGDAIALSFAELQEAAQQLKTNTGLNLHAMLTRLAQAKTCLNDTLEL